jgi:hypothetical protein
MTFGMNKNGNKITGKLRKRNATICGSIKMENFKICGNVIRPFLPNFYVTSWCRQKGIRFLKYFIAL